ncbi:chlorohydrolase [Streptococcus pneumoniae]|nr:chlorohydrolase [Streptococcus pneumoniae]
MKIKEQTRQLAAGCLKHCFEVADRATWFEEIFEEYETKTYSF